MSDVQYVVFTLGKEEYGIEISFVQEIIRIPEQRNKLPNMPSYIEGMIDLRDKVIPIIDLKKRFGFEQTERSNDNRLLILNLDGLLLGLVVDDVTEVLMIDDGTVEKLSSEISSISGNSIKGIGKVNGRLIVLLDALSFKKEIFQNI